MSKAIKCTSAKLRSSGIFTQTICNREKKSIKSCSDITNEQRCSESSRHGGCHSSQSNDSAGMQNCTGVLFIYCCEHYKIHFDSSLKKKFESLKLKKKKGIT